VGTLLSECVVRGRWGDLLQRPDAHLDRSRSVRGVLEETSAVQLQNRKSRRDEPRALWTGAAATQTRASFMKRCLHERAFLKGFCEKRGLSPSERPRGQKSA
jgi:hypothetical protein